MNKAKILPLEELLQVVAQRQAEGQRVVFTNGCFDLLHPGHVRYLERARELGDVLIVALNSDRTVRELKGAPRPLFPEGERAEILAALACVDYVTIFDDLTPRAVVARLRPQVLVKGGDWGLDQIEGREEVEKAGGSVVSLEHHPGYSTSHLLETIIKNFGSQAEPPQ